MADEKKLIREFKLKDKRNAIVWVYQGSKGANEGYLDILVKYRDDLTKTSRGRTPKHIDWVIDILLKKEHNKALTLEFVKYLLDTYDKIEPFKTKEEQQKCELQYTRSDELKKFEPLNDFGQFSIEFLGCVMELLSKEEKTGSSKAHMFRDVIKALYETNDIFSITNTATFRGR
jgi:murein L,D-transpeptidase YafK